MVQQTVDCKVSEYGLVNAETGVLKHDKQLPLSVASTNTALKDLKNESSKMVPKSVESSLFSKESVETVKVSGAKRPQLECPVRGLPRQPTTGNGHLVYVRRKQEAELSKQKTDDSTSNHALCPQFRNHGSHDEGVMQPSQRNDSMCVAQAGPIVTTSSGGISSVKAPVSLDLGSCGTTPPQQDAVCCLTVSTLPSSACAKRSHVPHWEERYCRLQTLLKVLDQSNQEDYLRVLRSLSSVELSRIAVELEKRAIHLSMEEAKEAKRVKFLDVMGKIPRISGTAALTQ